MSGAAELDYTERSLLAGHLDQRLDRLLHTQEVAGSNPAVPTIKSLTNQAVFEASAPGPYTGSWQFGATFVRALSPSSAAFAISARSRSVVTCS